MNRIIAPFFVVALLLATSNLSYAQESAPDSAATPPSATSGEAPASASSPLECSDYYRFGSVQADLKATVDKTVPGATLTFSGEVVNENAYPLLNGTLYVKIFQINNDVFAAGDGNPVVDQFVVKDGITLKANGSLSLTYDWKVPFNAEGGEYYAAYFFTTEKRYNLLGFSFTDDVVGNQALFTIANEIDTDVAKLSKIETTLNGQNHNFASFPLHFSAGDTVTIETTITNPSDEEKTLPLQWNQYSWDAINPQNLRHTKTELVTVPAGGEKTVSYEVRPQRENVVYVTAVTQDKEVKSLLNIRYVRDGIEETRLNFPGLSSFPIKKDTEATLFACAQSNNELVVPGNTLTLTLTDRDGKIIHEYRYEGDIAAAMGGYGEAFTSTMNVNYALLTATLERNGVIVEQVKTEYDCKVIDSSSCLPEGGKAFWDFIKDNLLVILLGGAGLLLVIAIITFLIKRRRNHIDANGMTTPLR